MRREQRVAMAAFRHHSHPCRYDGQEVTGLNIRYCEHKAVDILGDEEGVVMTVDVVEFLCSELSDSDFGDTITDLETNQTYRLGREVQDDGYMRTVESTRI